MTDCHFYILSVRSWSAWLFAILSLLLLKQPFCARLQRTDYIAEWFRLFHDVVKAYRVPFASSFPATSDWGARRRRRRVVDEDRSVVPV